MKATGEGLGRLRRSLRYLRLFVLATGAGVMAVEFSAERLLAPFFGSSELVWATLIALILLALSVGYAVGGRLADRWNSPALLGWVVLASGVYVAALPTLSQPLLSTMVAGLLNTTASVVVLALISTAVLFMPPVAALGVVSPYAARLSVQEQAQVGTYVGSLYAWSTFGSLVGTFVPVFLTIPDFGVRATLWLSGGLLILVGATAIGRPFALAALVFPLLFSNLASPLLKPVRGLIAEVETTYQFAQVYKLPSGMIALSVNDAAGIQSVYTKDRLTGLYYDAYLPLPFMFGPQKTVSTLVIGMGAGTIPTLYARDVSPLRKVSVTGVEIDPALTKLGEEYFHLSPKAAHVVHADGRVYLEQTQKRYDLIIVDAYSNEIYIPFTLTTREFFNLCRAHLQKGGEVALNVNATSDTSALLESMERTLMSVFPYVSLTRAPGEYNYLLVASGHPVKLPAPQEVPAYLRPTVVRLTSGWHAANPTGGMVLTDNRAPVENMTNNMILNQLRTSL